MDIAIIIASERTVVVVVAFLEWQVVIRLMAERCGNSRPAAAFASEIAGGNAAL
jgi:hypothetical protein|tara:strand:- start:206 stop:367 length:162 start_codon:yes stop_codon:yes gene_type:complete